MRSRKPVAEGDWWRTSHHQANCCCHQLVNDNGRKICDQQNADLDLQIGFLMYLCDLHKCKSHMFQIQDTRGPFFDVQTLHRCPNGAMKHKELKHQRCKSPGNHTIAISSKCTFFRYLGSHHLVLNHEEEKKLLTKQPAMEELNISPDSPFVCRCYANQAGAVQRGKYCL